MMKSIGVSDVTQNYPTGAVKLNWNTLDILAPQIIMLFTTAVLAVVIKIPAGRSRSAAVMIGFTGMVLAALVQLRGYSSFLSGQAAVLDGLSGWLILDPMGWILTFSILLLATATIVLRRLRNYSGHGDGRFCLLITLSTVGWSLMPAAANALVLASCMLLGSLPLWMLLTLGTREDAHLPLIHKALLVVLAVMLLALLSMIICGLGVSWSRLFIPGPHAAVILWAVISVVLFLLPILFWTGSMPLHWWFGEAAAETPVEVAFCLLLIPYVGSMAALLRLLFTLDNHIPAVAGVVTLAVTFAALMAAVVYGVQALRQNDFAAVAGNLVGGLAAMLLLTLCVTVSAHALPVAHLAGGLLLYALTVGLAAGPALGIMGGGKSRILGELPEWSRNNLLRALVLVLALLSLCGLPPTLGAITRMALFHTVNSTGTWSGTFLIVVNVLSLIVGGVATLRVAAYVFLDRPEIAVAAPPPARRRPVRHTAVGTLVLLLVASMINGAALLAYRPIQHLTMAFMPISAAATTTVPRIHKHHALLPAKMPIGWIV
ncbi:MAG: hypothetical protein M1472_01945 [Planctomycetes bacterium]|nr:hypothetical protein [Planctomycetota bacterium]